MKSARFFFGFLVVVPATAALGCSTGGGTNVMGSSSGSGANGGGSGIITMPDGTGGGVSITPSCDPCTDFPADPIVDQGVPEGAQGWFDATPSGAGPCILEPQDGSLLPNNWLRPRVNLKGATAGAVFQITFHSDHQTNDLVAYTTSATWVLPVEIWQNLAAHTWEEPISVTVRQSTGAAPSESVTHFQVAPVEAGGSMVFWGSTTTDPGLTTSALYGFSPGEEGVITALTPGAVTEPIYDDSPRLKREQFGAPEGQVRCVGCHTSTPGGDAVMIADHWPWNTKIVDIKSGDGETVGDPPSWATGFGALLTQLPWQGVSTFSKGDWDTGERRYLSSFAPRTIDKTQGWQLWCSNCDKSGKDDIAWFDLAAKGTAPDLVKSSGSNTVPDALVNAYETAWGLLARTGDSHGAVTPSWSHDGTTVAYTSTDSTKDGRVGESPSVVDIYTVPFNDGKGGAAKPVGGASEASAAEYYPNFSADDRYIAYTRVDNPSGEIYYRADGEIYVVPAAGGDATRLVANDPPQCSGEASPGVINSWPKWSPVVREANGKKYYFLIFSSGRNSPGTITSSGPAGNTDKRMSQLYMAALVEDESGKLTSYPGVYLWNQQSLVLGSGDDANVEALITNNVTPAWDEFQIPPVPVVVK